MTKVKNPKKKKSKKPKTVVTYTGAEVRRKKYARYKKYIASEKWREKREEAFEFYGRRCMKCGCESKLQVHHLSYKSLYKEQMKDLSVLCEACHNQEHEEEIIKKSLKKKIAPTKKSKQDDSVTWKPLVSVKMDQLIESLKTQNGGWTKNVLEALGVSWPPQKGWRVKLMKDYRNNKVIITDDNKVIRVAS